MLAKNRSSYHRFKKEATMLRVAVDLRLLHIGRVTWSLSWQLLATDMLEQWGGQVAFATKFKAWILATLRGPISELDSWPVAWEPCITLWTAAEWLILNLVIPCSITIAKDSFLRAWWAFTIL